jgi:putative sterol carrier protein
MAETVREVFEINLPKGIAANADKARDIDAVYQFDISGDGGGTWVIDLTKDADWISEGPSDDAQCTIGVSAEDWLGIMNGKLNAMQAFMMGKLKVSGDMGLATKLQTVFSMA